MDRKVIYVNSWLDARIKNIRDDAMLPITQKGVYFHHRLQLLIVVKDELDDSITNWLP